MPLIVFTCFERDRLAAFRKEDPDRRRVLLVSGKQVPVDEIADDDLWGVSIEIPIATPDYIEELQAIGLKVVVWVANDPEQWDDLAAMKPDVVMTGYPEKYQEWLEARE